MKVSVLKEVTEGSAQRIFKKKTPQMKAHHCGFWNREGDRENERKF